MILCGLALTPLSDKMKQHFSNFIQPWYADDNAVYSEATELKEYMKKLQEMGPLRGYCPKQLESILIPHPNSDRAKILTTLEDLGLILSDGHQYLGSFIGSNTKKEEWIQEQLILWSKTIETLSQAARRYPQSAYVAFTQSV